MSRTAPRVSIVIPAYNAARFLSATVESVRAQTFRNWELRIVDDGSADATGDLALGFAEQDPRIRLHRQENAGQSAARNAGFTYTDPASEYIIFLDSDDVWEKDTLATLVGVLDVSPFAPAAYGLARYIDEEGRVVRAGELERHQRERTGLERDRVIPWPLDRPTTFAVEALMERIITPGTVLIRRTTLERVGLFDTSIRLWEDWDLWLRICRRGEIAFVDRLVLGYRRHEDNLSNDGADLDREREVVRGKLLASTAGDPLLRRIVLLGRKYHRREVSKLRLSWATQSLRRGRLMEALKQFGHAAQLYTLTRA